MSNFFEQDVHKKLSILLADRYDVVCTMYFNDVINGYDFIISTGFWRNKQGI